MISFTIVVVDCAALRLAEEDVVVGLPRENVLVEVQLDEVRVGRVCFCGVGG
jgi:hypothetical protein